MHVRTLQIVLAIIGAGVSRASADPLSIIETRTETRICAKAEAKAFLGASAEGCFVLDSGSGDTSCFVRFCGGIMLSSPDLGVVGIKADFKAIQCYVVKFSDSDPQKCMKLLTGPGEDGKAARETLLEQTKQSLLKIKDSELKKIGFDREQVKSWKTLQFGPLHPQLQNGGKAQKALDKCPSPNASINSPNVS